MDLSNLFLYILLTHFHYISTSGTENIPIGGALKLCTESEEMFEISAKTCTKGVFLRVPMKPGCICFQGLWVLHSTLCDETPYIFYGENLDESCYTIAFEVSVFLYIGSPIDIRMPKYFVSPFSMTVFTEIPTTKSTPILNYYLPTIISLVPPLSNTTTSKRSVIQASVKGQISNECFTNREYIPKKMRNKVIGHIWSNGFGATSYEIRSICENLSHVGAYDEIILKYPDYYYRSTKRVPIPIPNCTFICTEKDSKKASAGNMGKEGSLVNVKSRKKRYKLRDTVDSIWNGLGFCMQSYWDPLLKFEMVSKDEKRCYPDNQ